MSSISVQLRAGEDEIRTILGILLKNLSEGITSRADVRHLGVLRSGTGEEDDEAEEMDEMCQISPETTTGYFSFPRLVFRLAKGEKGVSERFFLKSPNGWLKTRHREIDNTRRLWV